MQNIHSLIVLMFAVVGLVSCSNVSVSKTSDGKTFTQVPGVPFYTKIPMFTKETKVYASYLLIQLELNSTIGKTKSTTKYPETGPIFIPNKGNNLAITEQKIQTLLEAQGRDHPDLIATDKQLKTLITELRAMGNLVPIGDETDDYTKLLSNTWRTTMEVGKEQHYITGKTPLFGSADVQFDLNEDGTLTKAHSSVVDDTAKTLLSLFPISEFYTKNWKLGTYATVKADGGAVQAKELAEKVSKIKDQVLDANINEVQKNELLNNLDEINKLTAQPKFKKINPELLAKLGVPKAVASVDVVASIKEMKRFYSLKESTELYSSTQTHEPLKLSACKAGACQIVSVEEVLEGSDKKATEKGENKGYRIQATILPPESAEKPADVDKKK